MSAYVDISKWFNSDRNYSVGVGLYSLYSRSKNLSGYFTHGQENKNKRDKLEYELKKVLDQQPKTTEVVDQTPQEPAPELVFTTSPLQGEINKDQNTDEKPEPDTKGWDPEIVKLVHEKSDLTIRRDLLHKKRYELGDSNNQPIITQRINLTDQILRMTDRITEIRAIIDNYEATGQVNMNIKPIKTEIVEKNVIVKDLDRDQLYSKRDSLRPSISKHKKQLKNIPENTPKWVKLRAKIDQEEKMLEEVINKLK